MTTPDDLDQLLDQEDDRKWGPQIDAWLADPTLDPPTWEIDGLRTAEWCARRLLRAQRVIAQAQEEAARLRARADDYEQRVTMKLARDVTYFSERLRVWHAEVLAENPRAKTLDLPSGRLEHRAGATRVDVVDDDAARAWLEEHADACLDYGDPKIKKAEVKRRYGAKVAAEPGVYPAVDPDSGEVVPGVTIVRAPASSTFRPVDAEPAADSEELEG